MEGGLLNIYCKNCGAPADFDIIKQNYRCLSCDTATTQEESMRALHQLRQEARENLQREMEGAEKVLYECSRCGAKIAENKESVIYQCDFCGSKVVGRELIQTDHFPESIIPFYITLEEAKGRVKSWAKENSGKKEAKIMLSNLGKLRGYYLPYQMVRGPVSLSVSRSGTERQYYAEGYVLSKCVNASKQLDNLVMDAMEPYDWSKLEPIRLEYLAGQKAKLQDISEVELERRIREEVEEDCYVPLCKGLHSDGITSSASVSRLSTVPALLPAYILKTNGLMLAVNGQTGRVACSSEKRSYKMSWVIEPILMVLFLAALLQWGFESLHLTGIGSILSGILLAVIYSDRQESVVKRIIFRGQQSSARREGKSLIIDRKDVDKDKMSVVEPVFFERIDGIFRPVKIRVMPIQRMFLWLVQAIVVITLPILLATGITFAQGQRIPTEKFVYSAAWMCLAIPIEIILWSLMRRSLYEYPVFYVLEGAHYVPYKPKSKSNKNVSWRDQLANIKVGKNILSTKEIWIFIGIAGFVLLGSTMAVLY
ncbi:MAG: hypothetical protein Q4D77_07895 [Peptostreptococcaceae bacterium]|nr:hypothetical protein [Peptostreptococcaceae bacterium]